MICPHCKKELTESKWLDVSDVLPGMEVEIEVHDKGKSWNELKLSEKEEQLLTYDQAIKLANSKYAKQLKMFSGVDDFYIQQPLNKNKGHNYVARFYASSGRAILYCYRNPSGSNTSLGVRFIRKK